MVEAAVCRLWERWAFGFSCCPALWLVVLAQILPVGKFAGALPAECACCSQAAPADVGVAWVGCQAHLAMWQLLTKASIQNLKMLWMDFPFPISLILLLRKLLGKHQFTYMR